MNSSKSGILVSNEIVQEYDQWINTRMETYQTWSRGNMHNYVSRDKDAIGHKIFRQLQPRQIQDMEIYKSITLCTRME